MPPKEVVAAKNWGSTETERLIKLVEDEGVINLEDPTHQTKAFIESVRLEHFRHFNYKNFSRNYREKLRHYSFAGEYNGVRRNRGDDEGKNYMRGFPLLYYYLQLISLFSYW